MKVDPVEVQLDGPSAAGGPDEGFVKRAHSGHVELAPD